MFKLWFNTYQEWDYDHQSSDSTGLMDTNYIKLSIKWVFKFKLYTSKGISLRPEPSFRIKKTWHLHDAIVRSHLHPQPPLQPPAIQRVSAPPASIHVPQKLGGESKLEPFQPSKIHQGDRGPDRVLLHHTHWPRIFADPHRFSRLVTMTYYDILSSRHQCWREFCLLSFSNGPLKGQQNRAAILRGKESHPSAF